MTPPKVCAALDEYCSTAPLARLTVPVYAPPPSTPLLAICKVPLETVMGPL